MGDEVVITEIRWNLPPRKGEALERPLDDNLFGGNRPKDAAEDSVEFQWGTLTQTLTIFGTLGGKPSTRKESRATVKDEYCSNGTKA
ncbi:hypothetical protein DEO72_LG1g2121 [Vigna unguiculata]|uniref:Uncharacterized protein n=1 Tax=Vigna unguiculata TaxID=3917 RepID=A0A4D6KLQ4_VIGUN|nr:hypothetical protein DEO72_LG1g2121 [Vigna unguiculata]